MQTGFLSSQLGYGLNSENTGNVFLEGAGRRGKQENWKIKMRNQKEVQVPFQPCHSFGQPLPLPFLLGNSTGWEVQRWSRIPRWEPRRKTTHRERKRLFYIFLDTNTSGLFCYQLEIWDTRVCSWLPELQLHHRGRTFPKEMNLCR